MARDERDVALSYRVWCLEQCVLCISRGSPPLDYSYVDLKICNHDVCQPQNDHIVTLNSNLDDERHFPGLWDFCV